MFLRSFYLTFFFLLSSQVLAANSIHIEYGFNTFSLEVDHETITYQKKSYKGVVKKRKCSEKLFNHFSQKITAFTQKSLKDDKSNGDFMVKYRFNKKTGQLLPSTPLAKKLLSLPKDFESFRLATEFRCKGEKQ